MSEKIVILDYGAGNLHSIANAVKYWGTIANISSDPREVSQADRLIFPGVGAFEDGMKGLEARGLDEAIRTFVSTGRPFLGICLGMQMLGDVSEEFGEHQGLGLVPGRVVPVPDRGISGEKHKIPHIGWNTLHLPETRTDWQGTLLEGQPEKVWVYFVHSYMLQPVDDDHRLADTYYDGIRVTAAVEKDNITGMQFHPERSGEQGLLMMKKFLEM